MDLIRFRDIHEFAEAGEPFLLKDESEHNLILGLARGLVEDGFSPENPPYHAIVHDGGEVVAVALRTPPHKLLVSRGLSSAIERLAEGANEVYETLPGVMGPVEESRLFSSRWSQLTGQSYEPGIAQRIYQLERVEPVSGVPGRMRPAVESDRELLVRWAYGFTLDAFGTGSIEDAETVADRFLGSGDRGVRIWEDGEPVSMAGYSSPTPNGIRVSLVYTPPEQRGNGYASACTAALSQQLLDDGYRFCFLYTDAGNPTSNRIYQRIGYEFVAEVGEWVFAGSG